MDEAHNIRNRATLASKAACALSASRRWCLTSVLHFWSASITDVSMKGNANRKSTRRSLLPPPISPTRPLVKLLLLPNFRHRPLLSKRSESYRYGSNRSRIDLVEEGEEDERSGWESNRWFTGEDYHDGYAQVFEGGKIDLFVQFSLSLACWSFADAMAIRKTMLCIGMRNRNSSATNKQDQRSKTSQQSSRSSCDSDKPSSTPH